jgi:hypothetical protein
MAQDLKIGRAQQKIVERLLDSAEIAFLRDLLMK